MWCWWHVQGIKDISVQSSTSLQHLPYNKELETELPADLVAQLAFAKQKVAEIVEAASKAPSASAPASLTAALPAVSECTCSSFLCSVSSQSWSLSSRAQHWLHALLLTVILSPFVCSDTAIVWCGRSESFTDVRQLHVSSTMMAMSSGTAEC